MEDPFEVLIPTSPEGPLLLYLYEKKSRLGRALQALAAEQVPKIAKAKGAPRRSTRRPRGGGKQSGPLTSWERRK